MRSAAGTYVSRICSERGAKRVTRIAKPRATRGCVDELGAFEQLGRHIPPRPDLFLQLAPPRAESVGPRINRVHPPPSPVDFETTHPLVGVLLVVHWNGAPLGVLRSAVANAGREEIVTVLEDVGTDFEDISDDALHRVAARVELGAHALDHDRCEGARRRHFGGASSIGRGGHFGVREERDSRKNSRARKICESPLRATARVAFARGRPSAERPNDMEGTGCVGF